MSENLAEEKTVEEYIAQLNPQSPLGLESKHLSSEPVVKQHNL